MLNEIVPDGNITMAVQCAIGVSVCLGFGGIRRSSSRMKVWMSVVPFAVHGRSLQDRPHQALCDEVDGPLEAIDAHLIGSKSLDDLSTRGSER